MQNTGFFNDKTSGTYSNHQAEGGLTSVCLSFNCIMKTWNQDMF